VPRLKEIINVAKTVKTPGLTIYLKEGLQNDEEVANDVLSNIEYTVLQDVVQMTEIYYDPDPRESVVERDVEWVKDYYDLGDCPRLLSPWVLRIALTKADVESKKIKMAEIIAEVEQEYGEDLHVIATEDNADDLVLRVRIVPDEPARLNTDEDGNVLEEPIMDEDSEDDVFLKKLEKNLLKKLHLRGIEGVKKVFLRGDARTTHWDDIKGFVNNQEWVLETDGINLMSVLSVENVCPRRTTSNHVIEVFQVLGIEGVRGSLLSELRSVISFDGSYVNYRHLACLVDVMTMQGHLMAIDRHGINRVDSGPLLRCSFRRRWTC